MKKDHTPKTETPARTVFRLTDEEVAQALIDYVAGQGEEVPVGKRFVWVRDRLCPRDTALSRNANALATLVVDHGNGSYFGNCGSETDDE